MIRYFEDNLHATYNIRDPRTNATHVVDNWPSITFSELATNCILHKEYSKLACVEISVFKDHISFINHNRPLPPVTIEDLNTKIEFKDRKYLNAELKEMFFNLKLIQSYGSGIRRAKNSLNDIGSPALVYEPDNDTDDYTLVTAYINEEYACVRAEEEGNARKEKKPDENVGINVGIKLSSEANALLSGYGKKKREVASNILKAICDNNQITAPEIADTIGSTERTVQRYLREFQEAEIIIRDGSRKNGRWRLF